MLGELKALVVVLGIAGIIFHLAKPIALEFMSDADFLRRRRVWFVLTAVSFVSPNLWMYALVAVPLLIRAGRNDRNPIALYLLMLNVIPQVDVTIPILGNHGLFSLNNYRLLALCVLWPATIRFRKNDKDNSKTFGPMDVLLLGFGVLEVALYTAPDLPYHFRIPDSLTNAGRRAVLFLLDTYLLYFAVSRTCKTRQNMVDAMASFCLASAVMAAIAMFERARNWLLYVGITSRWATDPNASYYLERGGSVRAQASAGHSIALGFLLVIAFGFWLYLGSHIKNGARRIAVALVLWGGLFGAFSRGGWLGGATVLFTFTAVGPRAMSRIVRRTCLAIVVAGVVAMSPVGDQIRDLLPKPGQPADLYRYRLAERGWELVFAHPFFGNQFPWPEMEDLRQGEGIIDIVNTFLGVALNYGLVGLCFFLSFILFGLINVYARARRLARSDPDLALLGFSLTACIVGALIMIHSSSFIMGIEKMFYVLAGLSAAYVQLTAMPTQHGTEPVAGTLLQR